jgi:hypothetical protein
MGFQTNHPHLAQQKWIEMGGISSLLSTIPQLFSDGSPSQNLVLKTISSPQGITCNPAISAVSNKDGLWEARQMGGSSQQFLMGGRWTQKHGTRNLPSGYLTVCHGK